MFGTHPGSGIGLQRLCMRLASSRRFAVGSDTFKQFKGILGKDRSECDRFAHGRIDLEAGF